jgi:uncharacterized protein GlcG (DUF336 family)
MGAGAGQFAPPSARAKILQGRYNWLAARLAARLTGENAAEFLPKIRAVKAEAAREGIALELDAHDTETQARALLKDDMARGAVEAAAINKAVTAKAVSTGRRHKGEVSPVVKNSPPVGEKLTPENPTLHAPARPRSKPRPNSAKKARKRR